MLKLMALMALTPYMTVLAQAASDGGWVEIVATYGIASPFVLLCLYIMREQRSEIRELREDNRKLSDTAMERILPTSLEASKALMEASDALVKAQEMMHSLAGRPNMDPVLLARLTRALEDVERNLKIGGATT